MFLFAIGALVSLASLLIKDVGLEGPQNARTEAGRKNLSAAEDQGAIEMQGIENEDAIRRGKATEEA